MSPSLVILTSSSPFTDIKASAETRSPLTKRVSRLAGMPRKLYPFSLADYGGQSLFHLERQRFLVNYSKTSRLYCGCKNSSL